MSYSQRLLSNNGALESIKIAAYFFKRLKKSHVYSTDISSSVDKILKEEEQLITCRVLGYLLLGIVRIYSKKVEHLLYDCQEFLLGINNFVVHTKEDLPIETQRAPYFDITLPETFELDALDVDEVLDDVVDDNVRPIEEITLKESVLENLGTKQHAFDMRLYEDFAGSHHPCSAIYSPFDDILSTYGIDVNLRKVLNIDGLTTTMEIIQENGFSQRQHLDLVMLNPVEEEPQNGYTIHCEERQDNMEEIQSPDMHVAAITEVFQDCGENDVNHVKPSSEGPQIDQDQIMISESEPLGNETCQVDWQNGSPSDLQAETEKFRVNVDSIAGSASPSVLARCEEPRELVNSFVEENHEDGQQSLAETPENGEKSRNTIRDDDARCKKLTIPAIVTPYAADIGATTPQFTGTATPAPKERARNSRKRKCLIDEATEIPNKVMKQRLEDASDLVSKRRKVAFSALDVWKTDRSFPCHLFDPLLTGISPELISLFRAKKFNMTKKPCSKTIVPPLETLDVFSISVAGISEQISNAPDTPVQCTAGMLEQIGIAPETPVQRSTITKPFDGPISPGTPNHESIRPCMFESPRREPSQTSNQQTDLNLMDDEVTSPCSEEDNNQWSGWTRRTRTVVRYMHKSFQNLKERAEEETLSLLRVVEGKTRKESARLFYEVLVLSSKGFVDVKQEDGYGDILVNKLEKLDQICGVD